MSRHFTYRFWLCVVIGLGGLSIALLSKNLEALGFAAPFLWAIVFSAVDGWWPIVNVPEVELSSPRVIEGDTVEFHVRMQAPRAVPWVEAELQLPAGLEGAEALRWVQPMSAGENIERTFVLRATRWGVTGPEWLTISTKDRLGFSERVQHLAIGNRMRVHPPTELLTSLVPLAYTRSVTGDHRSKRRGGGTELAEVRPYRTGDPIRQIHTRLSGRRGTPMVLERHPDESSDVVLFVDSVQDVGIDLDSSLRWTVTAAIALSQRHLRSMDRVGILDRGAGVRWLPPKLGRRALHEIVDSLLSTAVLRPRGNDLGNVPVSLIPPGATVFAISPLLSTVVSADLLRLRRRGHEVIVIQPQPKPSSANVSALAHRVFRVTNEVRRRGLAEGGVVVVPWNPDEPLEPTLRRTGRNINRLRISV